MPAQYNEEDEINYRDDDFNRGEFFTPGSRSALRAGVRKFPCPTCGRKNALTAADVKLHYQCDHCADQAEGIIPNSDY